MKRQPPRGFTPAILPRLCFGAIAVFGQSITRAAGPFTESADALADQLDEIIVTAEKRTERLQEVPLSVSSINATALLEQNKLSARNYLTQVPGVALDEVGAGQDQLTIRGIATGYGTNPLVGITIDDVPFGSSVYSSLGCCILPELDPSELDRIEVLRGPQGTLYGANAMGGLLKYVTSAPSLTESTGRAELDASSVAHGNQGYGIRAVYSTPLVTDRFALQVGAFDRQDPGYIYDPLQKSSNVNETHVSGGRVALTGKPNDVLTIRLSALYQHTGMDGSDMVDIALSGAPLYGPYEHERMPGTDGLDTHLQFYSLNLSADLGRASLTSLSGYQRLYFSNPTDETPAFSALFPVFYPGVSNLGIGFQNIIHTDRFTQELRAASSGQERWQYLAGLFYSDETNTVDQLLAPATYTTGEPLTQLPTFLTSVVGQAYKQYAAFADVTLNLSPQFDMTAGGRYSHNEQNIFLSQSGLIAGAPTESASDTENPTTYSFTARYRFNPERMLYARVASGFRTGGPNFNYPPGHQSFEPDTTVNYELGMKSQWLDRRLTLDTAVYFIDWHKIQVLQTTSSGLTYFTNAGTASSKGIEMLLNFRPVRSLRIAGSVSYDDAKLTQDAPANTFYGLAGDRLPFTADWSANLTADYERPVAAALSMFAGVTATYTGPRLIDFSPVAAVPRLPMPAFTSVDLRCGVSLERLRATLFVRNVGDTRGYVGGLDFTAGTTNSPTGPWTAALITPRTVGVSLTMDF